MGGTEYDPDTHDAQGNRLDPPGMADLFAVATAANAEGRAALARAAATDRVLVPLGDAIYAAARALAVSAGGPLAGLGADLAREAVEAAIRRDSAGVAGAAGKAAATAAEEAARRLLGGALPPEHRP